MIHVFGNLGVLMVLAAYFLVSTGRIMSTAPVYQVLNLVGAAILIVYSVVFFAWANVALNSIWLLIALVSLIKIRLRGAPS
jgi:multidrug transporter EmrE-like cation transporter